MKTPHGSSPTVKSSPINQNLFDLQVQNPKYLTELRTIILTLRLKASEGRAEDARKLLLMHFYCGAENSWRKALVENQKLIVEIANRRGSWSAKRTQLKCTGIL